MLRDAFCVAGTVFVEVGVLFFVAGVVLGEILIDSWRGKGCIFFIQNAFPKWDEEGFRGSGCEIMILCLDCHRIVFLLAETIHGISVKILNI